MENVFDNRVGIGKDSYLVFDTSNVLGALEQMQQSLTCLQSVAGKKKDGIDVSDRIQAAVKVWKATNIPLHPKVAAALETYGFKREPATATS